MPRLTLTASAHTDIGLVRAANEDFHHVGADFALVADGLGGHASGEIASRLAVETVATHLQALPMSERTPSTIRQAVLAGHEAVLAAARADAHLAGMATTLTGLVVTSSGLVALNVGDSRVYRLTSAGTLEQLTRDDSLVADLVDAGKITPAFAPFHPQRNLITAALGLTEEDLDGECLPVSVRPVPAPAGRYVLCSDGLSDVVGEKEWEEDAAALAQEDDARRAARFLVELALTGGGPDNVTVLVADVTC